MASTSMTIDEENNRGSMWALDQNLDQPMEEEAGRLKNMYREKVRCYIDCDISDAIFIAFRVLNSCVVFPLYS